MALMVNGEVLKVGDIVRYEPHWTSSEDSYNVQVVDVVESDPVQPYCVQAVDNPNRTPFWASNHELRLLDGHTATSGEVRQTSDSGASKGSKRARFDMIPADALMILAEHYGIGAEKYQPVVNDDHPIGIDNWRLGYPWSLSYAAMQRHATQFWGGEDIDQETGSPHLAAVAWHALALLHWSLNEELRGKYDNRPRQ